MSDFVENLLEKRIQFWIRTALRLMSWIVLMFYMIWRIIIPLVSQEPIYLDKNDGYIMTSCITLLLAIEAVRAYVKRRLDKEK